MLLKTGRWGASRIPARTGETAATAYNARVDTFRSLSRPQQTLVALFGVYLFIYVFAVPMLIFDLVPTWGTGMGGFLLILQGALLAGWLVLGAGWRGGVAALLVALGGFVVEYVGVTTGWPFGRYNYTATLGIKLAGAVPLPIPFAWLLVVPAALGAATLIARGVWSVPCAAALALGLDLLIEPVAAYVVNYWQWIDSGPYYSVPTANFVAWGTTALVLAALTWTLSTPWDRMALPWLPSLLYVLSVAQFTLVDIAYGYYVAAIIGVGLLVLVGAHVINLNTKSKEQRTNP